MSSRAEAVTWQVCARWRPVRTSDKAEEMLRFDLENG
jgi:hypothetical protein